MLKNSFFGLTMLVASSENKRLAGTEVGQNGLLFEFFSILLESNMARSPDDPKRARSGQNRKLCLSCHYPQRLILGVSGFGEFEAIFELDAGGFRSFALG